MLNRSDGSADVRLHEGLAAARGFQLQPRMRVLDLGCGAGSVVDAFSANGYDAHGCDFEVRDHPRLRAIPREPYRLPFHDDAFNFACSSQVLEHVQDHDVVFAELSRILKPGGLSIHSFPSRWQPIEPHTGVPLASFFRRPRWLRLWATLGVRNEFQRSLPAVRVAAINRRYLREETKYLSVRQIERVAGRHFRHVAFVERDWLRVTGKPTAPGVATLYRTFRQIVLVLSP